MSLLQRSSTTSKSVFFVNPEEKFMMSSSTGRSRFPFTANQWQELEHQALIYKYMVAGMPVPVDLLYTIRRSLDSSLSSKLIMHQPHHLGWNCFQMGFGKKIDPEPGRCRRTDGKKWRCSKEAYPDSKYCERHMHRGRNRSRKPVEIMTATNTTTTPIPPTAIPISSINKNINTCSPTSFSYLTSSSSSSTTHEPHHQYPFLYRPPPQDHNPKFLFESPAYSRFNLIKFLSPSSKLLDIVKNFLFWSNRNGMKDQVDEHVFFSEASGTMRSTCGSNSVDGDNWQLSPLTMSSSSPMKQRTNYSPSQSTGHSYLQLQSLGQYYYHNDVDKEDHQPKKVMHHFFDEWPPKDNKNSWLDSDDKFSKTQLSISIPNPSKDFFISTNEK